ncbi:mitochondrial genome maintenance protein [Malassezia pachydermatis]|uniref:Mitochondrial genome maintenance protein MGM101 n=1 Tax=Malassezia pachydermatis TaxID=77020 RepID=A0A0M9VNE2_9BASI|nr:mitochondrial genome maintenance protein [Malassezia pachydermatis]KOS13263.1 mitochondrial genome maintenance protein [Malassezia pachydermatis]
MASPSKPAVSSSSTPSKAHVADASVAEMVEELAEGSTDTEKNPVPEKAWKSGFDGIGMKPFPSQVARILSEPISKDDVEIKPDGLLYLPEIKYRRILNKAFGPGGWGLAPQGEAEISQGILSREWTLICLGRFVSTARGEQEFFRPTGVPTANEGAKSNALMRCCKDLGIASELWDPRFIRQFKAKYCVEVWCQTTDGKKYVSLLSLTLSGKNIGDAKMMSPSNTPPKK